MSRSIIGISSSSSKVRVTSVVDVAVDGERPVLAADDGRVQAGVDPVEVLVRRAEPGDAGDLVVEAARQRPGRARPASGSAMSSGAGAQRRSPRRPADRPPDGGRRAGQREPGRAARVAPAAVAPRPGWWVLASRRERERPATAATRLGTRSTDLGAGPVERGHGGDGDQPDAAMPAPRASRRWPRGRPRRPARATPAITDPTRIGLSALPNCRIAHSFIGVGVEVDDGRARRPAPARRPDRSAAAARWARPTPTRVARTPYPAHSSRAFMEGGSAPTPSPDRSRRAGVTWRRHVHQRVARVDERRPGQADHDARPVRVHEADPAAEGVGEPAEALALLDPLAEVRPRGAGCRCRGRGPSCSPGTRPPRRAPRSPGSSSIMPSAGEHTSYTPDADGDRRPRRSAAPRRPRRAARSRRGRAPPAAASRRAAGRAASPVPRTPRRARGCAGRRGPRGSAAGWRGRSAAVCRSRPTSHLLTTSVMNRCAIRLASEPRAEPGKDRLRSRRSGR